MPLVDRFNRVTSLMVDATRGGVPGNALGDPGLGIVLGPLWGCCWGSGAESKQSN